MLISSWDYMFDYSNAPFGFVFHFALMQNETKDQDCAFLPDPLWTRKLKKNVYR